jgi:nucleoside-diphosphate-sugar epimerase
MGKALNHPARLLPVPQRFLEWSAALAGKQDMAQRLFSSLQVDMEDTRRILGWSPPVSLDQGLLQVAQSVLHR